MAFDHFPQFVITVLLLLGFAGVVGAYLSVNMESKNADVLKSIITGMGQACLLALGYWFGKQ